jgi:hypothetical protein
MPSSQRNAWRCVKWRCDGSVPSRDFYPDANCLDCTFSTLRIQYLSVLYESSLPPKALRL